MTKRRPSPARGVIAAALLLATAAFVALGIWQIERRAWKHALIAAVDTRIHAPAQPPPGPEAWARVSAASDGYRRLRVRGHYLPNRDTRVRAVSELGAGYWVLTPLDTGRFTLLINRGFVPPGTAIEIGARATEREVLVEVADRGPGLPPGTENRVFEKFFRATPEGGPRRGIGLGLAICRAIVAAHGGSIGASNRPEGGVSFRFTLPREGTPPVVDSTA